MNHRIIGACIFSGVLALLPWGALAATLDLNFTAALSAGNYTVTGNLSSITVSGTDITATIAGGENLTVKSPNTTKFTFDKSLSPGSTETCGTTYSITFTNPAGGASKTFTLTPIANTCSSSSSTPSSVSGSGSGSGPSGGGGGGGSLPATTPAPTPKPTPAATPSAAPAAQLPVLISDLSLGSENNEVAQLQAYLATDKSIYPEGKVTGYFGPLTQRAVKNFQKRYGLPQVGRVGPATRAKLNEVLTKLPAQAPAVPAPIAPAPSVSASVITKALRLGSESEEVKALQSFLAQDSSVYPESQVTGFFGPLTRKAVGRFQEKHGIAKVGEAGYGTVGPKTRAKLNELMGSLPPSAPLPAPAPVAPQAPVAPAAPATGVTAEIKALQDQLKALQDLLKTLQAQ